MKRVLVVDDDAILREMLELVLAGEGYTVAKACHGGEAIRLIESGWHPDVILLDMLMPVMGGTEVCTWMVRTMPHAERPPVIILSASLLPGTPVPEVAAILDKPCNLTTLVDLVGRLCRATPMPTYRFGSLAATA